jgi:hypothetical protein
MYVPTLRIPTSTWTIVFSYLSFRCERELDERPFEHGLELSVLKMK